ncbi:hypothetical protein Psi01_53670 [Planobispora siamensis]|uniref:Uncharacterized protein n=2 Tax=Planobispora siamensis TaxID=936338 RepID=A0A8J3SKV5_9ACTN|nr:hypothetical protein Psi01_53670 [Planobispora siamensis]
MILDRNNTEFGALEGESDDLTELRRLLFDAVPAPTEEESADMFAQTFSSDEADLSLLPDQDALSGEHAPDSSDAPADDASGPFDVDGPSGQDDAGADGPFGTEDAWQDPDPGDPGSDHGDPGDHGEDPHAHDDVHGGWDLFGGGL